MMPASEKTLTKHAGGPLTVSCGGREIRINRVGNGDEIGEEDDY
jgi:hypothetical protein